MLRLMTGKPGVNRSERIQLIASALQQQTVTKNDKDENSEMMRTPFNVMKKQRPKSRQVMMSTDKHMFGLTMPT
jgi:hypothetical protein